MDPPPSETNPEPQVVFRSSKKRKQFRQRAEESNVKTDDTTNQAAAAPAASAQDDDAKPRDGDDEASEPEGISVAEALRLRNARKSRLKGVEFRPEGAPSKSTADGAADSEQNLAHHQKEGAGAPEPMEYGVSRRFAPQAGLVGELVNKHMEEYIESELARRYAADQEAQASSNQQEPDSSGVITTTRSGIPGIKLPGDRPTLSGKLHEVDLGEEVRERNAIMTEQARRRLAGEAVEDESDGSKKRPKIGKDGKPWRPRKRRASEDIERDQLVDELMRENKLDVYDVSAQADSMDDTDMPADERIAREFRREFMDALALRRQQRRRAPVPASKAKAKQQEEVLRGPKLGGSRNARAAMRDILLSKQEKDKKRR